MKKRNVNFVKKAIVSCTAVTMAVTAAPTLGSASENGDNFTVEWKCSTESNLWQDMPTLTTTDWDDSGYDALYLELDSTVRYQTLTDNPWGGCFNERGWKAMEALTDEERHTVLEALFGEDGLGLTAARLPLGNSDFSIENDQSYDELPDGVTEDYDLEHFSIDNDREYLLPYIKEALTINPDLKFWASPWSPPAWMKENNSVPGPGSDNKIKFTSEILTAYANYFVKYIEAYEKEGIEISWVMPQNEPTINVRYPSCVWTGEQLNEFIRDYLYPAFQKNGVKTEIYLGTFTDSDASRTDPTLSDTETSKMIKGLGVQWWSSPLTKRIYKNNKDTAYTIIQSETMCGGGKNNWAYVEGSLNSNGQFQCLKAFYEAGVNAYMLWNMVLDEKGYNTNPSPWPQNAPVVVNSTTNSVTYTPQYYLFKHFTTYIGGGARRIKTSSTRGGDEYGDKLAFQNEDGTVVLEMVNSSGSDLTVCINLNGKEIKPTVPAHSINTFTYQADLTGFDSEDATYTQSADDENVETMLKLFNALDVSCSLTVSQASFDNGAEVIAWGDKGAAEQQWILKATDDGYFRIVSGNSEKSLGIYGGSTEEGGKAVQWDWDKSDNQQWKFEPTEKDGELCYKIKNKGSGLCLTYKDSEITNGTLAVQKADDGSDAFLWYASVSQGGGDLPGYKTVKIKNCEKDGTAISFEIYTDYTESYDVYAASYSEDGELIDVTKESVDMASGETRAMEMETKECGYNKIMLWKKGTATPAAKSVTI